MPEKIDPFIPHNEKHRLKKLYEYQILDTHPEDTFDKIAKVAAQIFNAQGAFVTFVDEDRVFFKANISSFQGNITKRKHSPCTMAILQDGLTVFYDTHESTYLKKSALVSEPGGVRFYAAYPLKTPEGFLLGTLCVVDNVPRETAITDEQKEMLKALSEIVINKLESRLRYKTLLKSQVDLMNIAMHEIKNPLASINLANDVLRKDITKADRMSTMIREGVVRIQAKLHDLLTHSEIEEAPLKLSIEETDLQKLFVNMLRNFELQANRKRQVILLEYDDSIPKILIDKAKISDVFHNLLSNALKYSYYDSEITIIVKKENNTVNVEFRDQGQGLTRDDISKLFLKFAKLSAKPTGKETSTGLGLSICKSFIELHHGKIYARSDGKDLGSSFFVSLPIIYEVEKEIEVITA